MWRTSLVVSVMLIAITLMGLLVYWDMHTGIKHLSASDQPQDCLARNIWYEARGEGLAGWKVVADVTLNRVANQKFPDSVCAVVYQPYQFSWTLFAQRPAFGVNWSRIRAYAKRRLSQPHRSTNELHYHASWMKQKPYWAVKKQVSRVVGQHVVYYN